MSAESDAVSEAVPAVDIVVAAPAVGTEVSVSAAFAVVAIAAGIVVAAAVVDIVTAAVVIAADMQSVGPARMLNLIQVNIPLLSRHFSVSPIHEFYEAPPSATLQSVFF